MTTNETLVQLKSVTLPINCQCHDLSCRTTVDTRFTHSQRDALQQAIQFYIDENDFTVIDDTGEWTDHETDAERNR